MPKRVIVIDDSREVGRVLVAALQTLEEELSVQVFISAEEALLEATRSPVDLLVCDLLLPGKSGVELVADMRQRRPAVRVIFITGVTDPLLIQQARKIETDGFFQKPINIEAFLEAVRTSLTKTSQVREVTAPLSARQRGAEHPRRGTGSLRAPGGGHSDSSRRGAASASISQVISAIRQRLGAQAVFILDDLGRVIERAGELPAGDLEREWAPRVLSALSAARRPARLVGDAHAPLVIALQGEDYHLAIAPVGDYALNVLLKPGRGSLRLGLAVEEALLAQMILVELMGQMGMLDAAIPPAPVPVISRATRNEVAHSPSTPTRKDPTPPPVPGPPPMPEPALEEFTEKIDASSLQIAREKVDAYWEDLATRISVTPQDQDIITYEQAKKLGLAPREANE